MRTLRRLFLPVFVLTILAADAGASTLLLNGDFEATSYTTLPNGDLRYLGWTGRSVNGGLLDMFLEGTNSISGYDTTATRFDGPTSGAPDPFNPYQSESDMRLDYFAYVRPSVPAPESSYGLMISDPFLVDGDVQADMWRENNGSLAKINLYRASDDSLLRSLTVTTTSQAWERVTLSASDLAGTKAYLVLEGGTSTPTQGWLSIYDNVYGGITPEPATLALLAAGGLGLLRRRGRR